MNFIYSNRNFCPVHLYHTVRLVDTVFPHIVSSLEYFPPLNTFLAPVRKQFSFLLLKGKLNLETF